MAKVKIFTPVNRLQQVLSKDTGRSERDITGAAQQRVENLKPEIKAQVAQVLAALRTLRGKSAAELAEQASDIADDAMLIAELAGAGGWPRIGDAARGVLAVLPSLDGGGPKISSALQVHLDALELLAADPEPSTKDADAILARLAHMRRAIGLSD